jgi:shikimate dehydrogenase
VAITVPPDIATAVIDADGVVNCTPVGMIGHPGSAVDASLLGGQRWAFDAVYTPVDTQFLGAARRAGLATISGYELFFHQGIQAFELFTGRMPPDLDDLRRQLLASNTRPGVQQ